MISEKDLKAAQTLQRDSFISRQSMNKILNEQDLLADLNDFGNPFEPAAKIRPNSSVGLFEKEIEDHILQLAQNN